MTLTLKKGFCNIHSAHHLIEVNKYVKYLKNQTRDAGYMGLVATKPVFGVSDKVRFKAACSATETSWKNKISLVASLDMILSKMGMTKALISLRGCVGWSAPVLFANP